MSELKPGTKIKGRYTLIEFKGSGSFGEVWLALDEVLDSDVAIKIYISLDPRGVEEFKSEYITTQGIYHPNLLTTSYFDVWEQRPYLVMKYCEKGSSTALSGQMDEYDLWKFIHDVAAGLKHLHGLPEPIIHQDIKPDNILIDDTNHYLITDFGISKKIRSTMRKQSKRAVGAGATAYMGPERFDSDPSPVKASDIWSLGASIYELATGQLPFSGMGGGMQKNGAELPVLDNKWSKEMTMVMQSCLAKETWDRPTAEQLEKFSDAILKGEPAEIPWKLPEQYKENTKEGLSSEESSNTPGGYEKATEAAHSNKNRIWLAVFSIIIAIIILIIIWPSNNDEPVITSTEPTTEEVVIENPTEKEIIEVPEVETTTEYNNNQEAKDTKNTTTNQQKTIDNQSGKKEEAKPDNNATLLKNALASGDYQQVQMLANQGYAPAYAPLAKYYLQHNDYDSAEWYAQKAKRAGDKRGDEIIETLRKLGKYD